MWRSGLAMARDHPLTGVGPGLVKQVYPRYAAPEVTNTQRSHVHNAALQVLIERGVLGLAAWLWLFAAFFVRAARLARAVPATTDARALVIGAIAAVTGFLVAGLTENNFSDSEVLLTLTFVMALAFVAERDVQDRRANESAPAPSR
jgi:O-antigen ligase